MQCFKQDEPIYFSLLLFNIQCIHDSINTLEQTLRQEIKNKIARLFKEKKKII